MSRVEAWGRVVPRLIAPPGRAPGASRLDLLEDLIPATKPPQLRESRRGVRLENGPSPGMLRGASFFADSKDPLAAGNVGLIRSIRTALLGQ